MVALWPDSVAALLDGTDLEGVPATIKHRHRYFYANFVAPFLESVGKGIDNEDEGAALFLKAIALSKSRGFFVDQHYGEALVPYADLMNHLCAKPSDVATTSGMLPKNEPSIVAPEMEVAVADAGKSPVVVLADSISRGNEVLNTYGELSNTDLLADYGSVPQELNPFDCIIVEIDALARCSDQSARSLRWRMHALWSILFLQEQYSNIPCSRYRRKRRSPCSLFLCGHVDDVCALANGGEPTLRRLLESVGLICWCARL